LTSDQALVWDYAAASGVSKILALPLPPALKNADPLPLGQIVRNGPTNDFGVVAVAPSTGKIVFWENIDSAETRSLFTQRKQGLEGALRIYSGERITDIVDVDHAGYILVLSSGRLAQLTLRDAQGRPSIATNVLNSPSGSSSSLFSLKGLLGGAIRKTIASVKAHPSESKGQMEVIAATKHGLFELWDLTWSGQQIFKREIDAREKILATVQQGSVPEIRGQQEVQILDFAIRDRSSAPGVTDVLVLVALFGRNMLDHFLLEVDITEDSATVSLAIPLSNYCPAELPKEPTGALLLPDPGHTALVQFPDAVVVASLVQPEDGPEAQLVADSGVPVLPYQDCIYFKLDAHVRSVGHALEPAGRKNQTSSAIVFIQDFGIIQISAYSGETKVRSKVSARSKLQQATFFSTVPGTILDFATKGRYSFSQAEVETAAIKISTGVLSSAFEQLEGNSLMLEDQLRKRALALQTLNTHLRTQFPDLSFSGRWQLLWHAEKLAAAINIWEWYQRQLRKQETHPDLYPEKNILGDIVKALHEKFKTPIDETKGEKDPVRQFFLKDIDSLDILLPWTWNYFRLFYIAPDSKKSITSIMQRLREADEVVLTAFETAFSFRKENIEQYGLEAKSLDNDGILRPGQGYDKLPQNIWTSTHNLTASLRSIVDAGRKYSEECYEKREEEVAAQEVAQHNPRLVRISCQTHIERFRWALDQSDEKKRSTGMSLREEWNNNVRPKQIYHLAGIGLATEGMNLAEHYHDMPTLVDLIWEETLYLEEAKAEVSSKMIETEISLKLHRIKDRVAACFKRYNDGFADAYFSKYIIMGQSGLLLKRAREEDENYQKSLSTFLSADPSRSRLSWINNICGDRSYSMAAKDLQTATQQEPNSWCNTVELSIAKLSALAQQERDTEELDSEPASTTRHAKLEKVVQKGQLLQYQIENDLEVASIQAELYAYVHPTIVAAMDNDSAVQLLMTEHGQGRLSERPSLQHLLQQGFEQLVQHQVLEPCLFIDVLTLMTYNDATEAGADAWNPFALALRFLAMNNLQRTVGKGLPGLIWKRILLQDDWAEIDRTQNLSSEAMTEYLGQTIAGSTVRALTQWMLHGKHASFDMQRDESANKCR
jgi:nuclear pore complex protein Nup133